MTDLDPALKAAVEGLDDPVDDLAKTALPMGEAAERLVVKLYAIHGEDAGAITSDLFTILMAVFLGVVARRTDERGHPLVLLNAKTHVDSVLAKLMAGESLNSQLEPKGND